MSLRNQATSLAFMHAVEVAQPLLVLPYAAKVFGPAAYGQYAYVMSIGQLATTIVGYGFHWTAQRAAAVARRDPNAIASIVAQVTVAKAALCIAVTCAGLAISEPFLSIHRALFLCVMLNGLGEILFPAWLFIGLECAWRAAIASIIARCAALLCFATLVKSSADLGVAVATQSAIPLFAGLITLRFAIAAGRSGFRSVTLFSVAQQLRQGARGFLFTLVETAIVIFPVPLVAHLSSYYAAGQFSVADKFVAACKPALRIIQETFLPKIAYLAEHDPKAGVALVRRASLSAAIGAVLSLGLFFVAPSVILTIFGPQYAPATWVVRLLSPLPILMNLNIITSNLYMFNFGHERAWAVLTVGGLLVFLAVPFSLDAAFAGATVSVALGLIARQTLVLVVSAAFFFIFGPTRMRRSESAGGGATQPSVAVAS